MVSRKELDKIIKDHTSGKLFKTIRVWSKQTAEGRRICRIFMKAAKNIPPVPISIAKVLQGATGKGDTTNAGN